MLTDLIIALIHQITEISDSSFFCHPCFITKRRCRSSWHAWHHSCLSLFSLQGFWRHCLCSPSWFSSSPSWSACRTFASVTLNTSARTTTRYELRYWRYELTGAECVAQGGCREIRAEILNTKSLFQIDTKDTKGTKDTEADKVENGRPARSSPSNRSQVKSAGWIVVFFFFHWMFPST